MESNPEPPDLLRSVSTNCATAGPLKNRVRAKIVLFAILYRAVLLPIQVPLS